MMELGLKGKIGCERLGSRPGLLKVRVDGDKQIDFRRLAFETSARPEMPPPSWAGVWWR
jgi:hypothetical protein